MKLNVLYDDNHVLVVEKPACMPIVPDDSGDESLLDIAKQWVKEKYQKPGAVFLGVVHRLDRPVSGVVVFARTSKAAARLSKAWKENKVEKMYVGVSSNSAPSKIGSDGEWTQWLYKDRKKNRVSVNRCDGAKEARTEYRVVYSGDNGCLLHLWPITGRSHQLRVACATNGMVLLGDLKYGSRNPMPNKEIGLHAAKLSFPHPTKGELVVIELPAPAWAAEILRGN
ncbi:MAG TPA: RNA pseudouridine synthase [Planctomycetes bacterium]|jgi:23S rRNA pseudouridine1911/1915/1917 synthase|nr:RNA pseudouridine synthase [Planctomycetota bacterium]